MAKAAKVLESVIGMVAKADGGKSPVDLAGVIVEAVKRLAADSDFIKAAVMALRAAGVKIPEAEETPKDADEPQAPKEKPPLVWGFGGFDGSKAAVSEDAVLAGATLKGDTLTFEWAAGDCRNLGATSKTDSDHTVACLFVECGDDGEAFGGKVEWISTSRKTRSMKNIKDGYQGWPKDALEGGHPLWFCIAGVRDDKKTSNGRRTALIEVVRK